MKQLFEYNNVDKENPPIYQMICWICKINSDAGIEALNFDEFITQATFYFSQREEEEGLKYIFSLFDHDNKGYVTRQEFIEACLKLEMRKMSAYELEELFDKASNQRHTLDLRDFIRIMRTQKKSVI